jgi:hypothetical protein
MLTLALLQHRSGNLWTHSYSPCLTSEAALRAARDIAKNPPSQILSKFPCKSHIFLLEKGSSFAERVKVGFVISVEFCEFKVVEVVLKFSIGRCVKDGVCQWGLLLDTSYASS